MTTTKSHPTPSDLRGRTALVTGASSGIGAEFADRFGQRGANLVLVARSRARLEAFADDLRQRHGVEVLPLALDLSAPGAATKLVQAVTAAGITVDVLVNNAGSVLNGPVATTDPAAAASLIALNATVLTETTIHFVKGMVERGQGTVVNVASTGAFLPTPYMAVYSASKAYVLSFTQALWAENRHTGVRVLALCPGSTDTPMNSDHEGSRRTTRQVVDTAMKALATEKSSVVDGAANAFLGRAVGKRLPDRAVLALAERRMRPPTEVTLP